MSHLLQMRGLKQVCHRIKRGSRRSHLLQMRGLKQLVPWSTGPLNLSHLLQMRGLKRTKDVDNQIQYRRIFYRCVD